MNKILYAFIGLFIIATSYGIYTQVTKKPLNTKRVSCQNKTTTFEKINKNANIQKAKELFLTSNYDLSIIIDYSKYMKSNLKSILDEQKLEKMIKDVISNYEDEDKSVKKNLTIHAYLYENDKEDKGKKSKKAKLYAGYILMEFKLNNKSVYKIQTDYMNMDTSDLKERIDCSIKSFVSIK
ncbi:hypothetical protein [Malaciobacter marinus]|uniref:hypothetical protein n=1 Tax=Malaciobacter marinus TaxID=505249 RepID=UPI003B009C0F